MSNVNSRQHTGDVKLGRVVWGWALAGLSLVSSGSRVGAAPPEPGWADQIIPTGRERVEVKSTPIELRPYRPLHFYGNTVRRRYYRGSAVPMPRDVMTTAVKIGPNR